MTILTKTIQEKEDKLKSLKTLVTSAVYEAEQEAIASIMKGYNFYLASIFMLGWPESRYQNPGNRTGIIWISMTKLCLLIPDLELLAKSLKPCRMPIGLKIPPKM